MEPLRKYRDAFAEDLAELGLVLSEDEWERFVLFYDTLIEWNEFMNLTAITDIEGVLKKHFVDSLSIAKTAVLPRPRPDDADAGDGTVSGNPSPLSLIDVGTGAGFPGIPIKIMFPEIRVVLMDSLGKRVKFLNEIISRCNLKGIAAIHSRAEDLARDAQFRDSFDICVSRAVAALGPLCEYCLPFVKRGGCFVAYKSEKAEAELEGSEKGLKALGAALRDKWAFELPGTDLYRNLLLFEKTGTTPRTYPRKAGVPTRQPLF